MAYSQEVRLDCDEQGDFLPWEARLYYASKPKKAANFSVYRAEENSRGRGNPVVLEFPNSAVANENPVNEESFANYAYTTRTIPSEQLTTTTALLNSNFQDLYEGNERGQAWYRAVADWKQQLQTMHDTRRQTE